VLNEHADQEGGAQHHGHLGSLQRVDELVRATVVQSHWEQRQQAGVESDDDIDVAPVDVAKKKKGSMAIAGHWMRGKYQKHGHPLRNSMRSSGHSVEEQEKPMRPAVAYAAPLPVRRP
jgi:hypothetical protein